MDRKGSLVMREKTSNVNLTLVVVPSPAFYLLLLHLKLSSVWYSTQLVDMFAYEIPSIRLASSKTNTDQTSTENLVTYNFHNLFSQERFFLVVDDYSQNKSLIKSSSNVFANANWLERELSEMSGLLFENKADVRNLLLMYGDTLNPLRKSVPSIGFKEVMFDINNDFIVQTPVTIQV